MLSDKARGRKPMEAFSMALSLSRHSIWSSHVRVHPAMSERGIRCDLRISAKQACSHWVRFWLVSIDPGLLTQESTG